MNEIELPRLKGPSHTQRLTIPVDPDLKSRLARLKAEKQVDVTEWIRRLIRKELEKLDLFNS